MLRDTLESSRQLRICRAEYWDVSHFTGWQLFLPLIAQQQLIGSAALRAQALDPGIHAFGWTRERAVAYLKSTGNFNDQTADDMVDRIATLPGQLTAYDSGGLEFFALRKQAQVLGASFDIRRFHRAVLEQGSVPLQELRDHVHEWIAAERASAAR